MKRRGLKSFILGFLAMIVSVAGYVFLWTSIEAMVTDAAYLRGDLLGTQIQVGTVAGAEKLLADTKTKRGMLQAYFVAPQGTVDFINFVESIGKTSGVTLEIENLGEVGKESNDFSEILTIETTITGSFRGVFYFLSLLENAPYQIEILAANIERQGEDPKEKNQTWQGRITFHVLKIK